MEERKWLLLKAIECNWDEIGPGDWTETKWLIFSDGSYEIVSSFDLNYESPKKTKKTNGQMSLTRGGEWDIFKLYQLTIPDQNIVGKRLYNSRDGAFLFLRSPSS